MSTFVFRLWKFGIVRRGFVPLDGIWDHLFWRVWFKRYDWLFDTYDDPRDTMTEEEYNEMLWQSDTDYEVDDDGRSLEDLS